MANADIAERLLADAAWLRRFTRHLVGDAELAADLQQDVAVAALTRPVDENGAAADAIGRSWLAAVARNLAATLLRRKQAEQRRLAHRGGDAPVPSPADLVTAAEQQQRAVAAVLALPQPYRDTVLLRFMQGVSLQAAARAMGVAEETVRTRQKRALAMLRTQLAPRSRRRGLLGLLVPLWAAGAIVNGKQVLVAAAAVLLLVLGGGAVWWNSVAVEAGPEPRAGTAVVAAQASTRNDVPTPPAAEQVDRSAVAVPAPASAPAATADASLTVRVRWADGTPASDVAVHCGLPRSPGAIARTDRAGEARFEGLEPAGYRVTTPAFDSERIDLAGGADEVLELTLGETLPVHGRVVDADGGPVPHAQLLQSMPGIVPQWTFPLGTCDGAGRFDLLAIGGLPLLGARDAQRGVSDFKLLPSSEYAVPEPPEIVLRLVPRVGSVRGVVVDGDDHPVAGAWVQVGGMAGNLRPDDRGGLWQAPPAGPIATGADGRFALAAVRVDGARLQVYRAGFALHLETLELLAGAPTDVRVVLRPGGTLRGVVRAEDGRPLADAEVEFAPWAYPQPGTCDTDALGNYELRDLPPGEVRVTVRARGWSGQEQAMTFAGGEERRWDIELRRGLAVRGRLVDAAGDPLVGWALRGERGRGVLTDDGGAFTLTDWPAGGGSVFVRERFGFVPLVLRVDEVQPGAGEQRFVVTDDRMPTARLRGRCLDANGTPLVGITLGLMQGDDPVYLGNEAMHTAADGSFELGPLPPDTYELQVGGASLDLDAMTITLAPREVRDLGELRSAQRR